MLFFLFVVIVNVVGVVIVDVAIVAIVVIVVHGTAGLVIDIDVASPVVDVGVFVVSGLWSLLVLA